MISKGWADILGRCMFCFSISRVAVGVMYPAVAIAGCSIDAQWSLIMLCTFSLLVCLL